MELERLHDSRTNDYLRLPEDVVLTEDVTEAVEGSEAIAIAVPAQELRSLVESLSGLDLSEKLVLLCMKGLELETGLRLTEVVLDGLESGCRGPVAWLGPGHPQELTRSIPSCMLLVSDDEAVAVEAAEEFGSDLIRFYWSTDLIGCEIGAAAKNVVGIAAGILDGLKLGSLKGPLMARAPQEIARLVSALGGDWRSVYGLSHLGDYEATLFSSYSRNRGFGEALALGKDFEGLAEGVPTTGALLGLARRHAVEMPITEAVQSILTGETCARAGIERLFSRPQRDEFPSAF
jgi:glycerol-3-phosphate dehydrogenase (NAD(P)+)